VSDPRTLAAEVGAKADLLGIALRSASAELTPPEDVEQLQMSVSWETSFERLPESQVEYRYRIAVTDAQTEAFSVRAEFALTYALESTAAVSDEHLEAFGEVSVVFSAFPYARELIQSLTSRASLPPLVLGTLRAPIDPPRKAAAKRPANKAAGTKKARTAAAGKRAEVSKSKKAAKRTTDG
jgi:preprotein translocase subunit SecB